MIAARAWKWMADGATITDFEWARADAAKASEEGRLSNVIIASVHRFHLFLFRDERTAKSLKQNATINLA